MFKRLSVPILGVVENMTAFVCPHCGEAHEIFGRGGGERFAAEHGIEFLGGVPLDVTVRQGGDVGVPGGRPARAGSGGAGPDGRRRRRRGAHERPGRGRRNSQPVLSIS